MRYIDMDIFEKHNLLQSVCEQRRTKNVFHHPVIQGLGCNPLQSLSDRAPSGELRMKNRMKYSVLGINRPLDSYLRNNVNDS